MASPIDITAAILHGAKDIRITQRQCPAPGPGEATIRVKATGLCGSDLHYYNHGRNGDFVVRDPMALGHEAAGEITAVGSGVTAFSVGDRVAIEAGQYCGSCRLCKQGRYNLCPNLRFASSAKTYPHLDGTLQSHMNFPVKYLHKMSDNITFEQGSLVEPLSVCLQAAKQSKLRPGHSALVLGAGAVGLLMCAVARASGAASICAVDIDSNRVDFATKQGFATNGRSLERKPRPETNDAALENAKATSADLINALAKDNGGFDIVYECTGVENYADDVQSTLPGGCVCLVGMGSPNVFLPLGAAALREVDIVGVFRYCNTYPDALAMIASGRLDKIEKLVTHRFPLSETQAAFASLAAGKAEDGKPVIKIMIGEY